MLRDYQQRSIDMLYEWFARNPTGNPCIVMPTGSGKSHIVAALCKDALQNWPETRILMLTHVKELIEQNAEKMYQHWPDAPLGIYSAGIGMRQLGEPITFAGIQSVRSKPQMIGHVDLAIIDECHLVSHKEEGGYRKLLAALTEINPGLRVIGLTATPYRLGHGLITDKPALFDALIKPVEVSWLMDHGYLARLKSKLTHAQLDVSGVHKRGGEYIDAELQAAVNNEESNRQVVQEVIACAEDRKAWLFFCAGVAHAQAIADELNLQGIVAECITGDTPKAERERILSRYKQGEIRALTNANVLTTGFDYPDIDLIAMLRPTLSPGLYVQMAGRGMRLKSHADHCLVLDFAGVVAMHGPIVDVQPPSKVGGDGTNGAPTKTCEVCREVVSSATRICPACGAEFPKPPPKPLRLHDDDIMGTSGKTMEVAEWQWEVHTSRSSGKKMLACTYYALDFTLAPIREYLPLLHEGYAGDKSLRQLATMASSAGVALSGMAELAGEESLVYIAEAMNQASPPDSIDYKAEGKFHRVLRRKWNATTNTATCA